MTTINQCEWFVLCPNPATGTVAHPILGEVPTCERCAKDMSLDLKRYPARRQS